jgi:cysteine desulfuration protein SufE
VNDRLAAMLDAFSLLTDRGDRIEELGRLARAFRTSEGRIPGPPFPEGLRVPGCESEVFVQVRADGPGLVVDVEVENPQGISAMAVAAVLQDVLEGLPPAAAAEVPDDLATILFGRELSMGKSLGLNNLVMAVKRGAARLA